VIDWSDRTTAVLFGDGAGAVVLEPGERGLLAARIASDGSLADALSIPGGGSQEPLTVRGLERSRGKVHMVGQEVFRAAVRHLTEIGAATLADAGLGFDEVDWFVPHQANLRILAAVAERWGVSLDRFVLVLEETGNTSSASVPIALDRGIKSGRIRPGQRVLTFALGAGLSYGAVLIEV
jgi:3-oxoacyl-[acyl-carrier-protein] synthase-3